MPDRSPFSERPNEHVGVLSKESLWNIHEKALKEAKKIIQERTGKDVRNVRLTGEILYSILQREFSVVLPLQEQFIERYVRALTRDFPFEETLYESSLPALELLRQKGPVWIWSKGDSWGLRDEMTDQKIFQGSHEQPIKVIRSGLNTKKKESRSEEFPLKIAVAEDKQALLEKIINDLRSRNIASVLIGDDRGGNLLEARKSFQAAGFDVICALVTGWKKERRDVIPRIPKQFTSEEDFATREGAIVVSDLSDIVDYLKKRTGTIASIIDFDDVIASDARKEAKLNDILSVLIRGTNV